MEVLSVVVTQIVIMFLLMAVGYVLYKLGIISNKGNQEMSNILVRVVIPCAILKAYMTTFTAQKAIDLGMSFLLVGIAFLVAIITARLICRRKSRVDEFGVIISNAGFIGIPLVQAVLGSEAVFYMSAYMVALNIVMWTYGLYILSEDKACLKPRKILINPVVIASALGLILFLVPFQMPEVISQSIGAISGMLTPLAMIVSGVYLAQTELKKVFLNRSIYLASFTGLIIIPLILIVALIWVPSEFSDVRMTIFIGAAVPSGSVLPIFAHMAGKSEARGVQLLCQSTLLSLITLPLMVWLASMVW